MPNVLNSQLTKKQARVLDYVTKCKDKKNYSTALTEIADHFEISIPTVHQHVDYLERKGYLVKNKEQKHSIKVLKTMREILPNIEIAPIIQLTDNEETRKYKELPLNKIICGDVGEVMKKFPSNSVDIIVTSPPNSLMIS